MVFEDLLIQGVKNYEILYNKKIEGHKNVARKAKAWENISKTVGKPVPKCIKRWKNLRDRFCKILKKNIASGSEHQYQNKSEWEYYDSLSFLKEHIQPRRNVGNLSATGNTYSTSKCSSPVMEISLNSRDPFGINPMHIEENISYIDSEDKISTRSSKNYKRKNTEFPNEVAEKIVKSLSALEYYLKRITKEKNFSAKVEVLLNGMKSNNKQIAEKKIIEYLCKCQIADLNDNNISNIKFL